MLDSILERPSLEGTQAESNLNGTARLSIASCQTGFCRLNGAGGADVGPSGETSLFGLASVQQSPFSEVREWRPTSQIEGTAVQCCFLLESRVFCIWSTRPDCCQHTVCNRLAMMSLLQGVFCDKDS